MIDQLYDLIGGKKTVWAATDAFYKRVLRDETLRPFFKDTDLARLRERQSMFVAMLLGGQTVYTGKDLSAAHAGARAAGLTDAHFDSFLKHFRGALLEVGVQAEKVDTVMELLESRRGAILKP
jgi:hemoglobin